MRPALADCVGYCSMGRRAAVAQVNIDHTAAFAHSGWRATCALGHMGCMAAAALVCIPLAFVEGARATASMARQQAEVDRVRQQVEVAAPGQAEVGMVRQQTVAAPGDSRIAQMGQTHPSGNHKRTHKTPAPHMTHQ